MFHRVVGDLRVPREVTQMVLLGLGPFKLSAHAYVVLASSKAQVLEHNLSHLTGLVRGTPYHTVGHEGLGGAGFRGVARPNCTT